MRAYRLFAVCLALSLVLISGGMLAAQDLTLPPTDLRVIVREGSPAPVLVEIDVTLSDGCARVGDITQAVNDDVVTITIGETRVGDPFTACTQALVPVTVVTALDLTGLTAGDITIEVGTLSATTTLTDDLLDAALCFAGAGDEADDEADAVAESAPVVNVAGGYCLLLPVDYSATLNGAVTSIFAADTDETDAASDETSEEATPVMMIASNDATAEDFTPLDVDAGEAVALVNADGFVLDTLDEAEGERFLVIVTELTQIVASDLSDDAILWEALLDGLTVFDPYTVETDLSTGQATP